jgi:hypothetical protein
MKPFKKMLGITLIIIGLLLTISGIILVISPNPKTEKITENVNEITENTLAETKLTEKNTVENMPQVPDNQVIASIQEKENSIKEEAITPTVASDEKKPVNLQEDSAEKKGLAFTKSVIAKFDKKYFKLKEWRSDKYDDGVYPEANMYPDLEFEFTLRDVKSRFAVECKWRKSYYKNGIEWAKEYQLKNYKKFKTEKSIPVFVAIGVGGTPEKPEEVYIVPLTVIENIFISQAELKKYQKADFQDKNFFYDSKTEILK